MRVAAAASAARCAVSRVVPPALPATPAKASAAGRAVLGRADVFARSMVSASSPAFAKKKKGGAAAAAAPPKPKPKLHGLEAREVDSWKEPSRFARGSGRRRTAAERSDTAAALSAEFLKAAQADGGSVHARPLPGTPKTLEELEALRKRMRENIAEAGASIDEDHWFAHDKITRGEDARITMERAKARASKLMDQTETGPVRVRGAMSMAAQVERQSIYAEAEATRAFYRDHEVGGDDLERWRGDGPGANPGQTIDAEDGKSLGFEEEDFTGPRNQEMVGILGEDMAMWNTDDGSGDSDDSIMTPFGTAPRSAVRPGMVEEFASPIKYVIPEASDDSDNPADVAAEPTLEKDYTKGTFGIVDPRLSTVEQELDAERRALRAKFLDPLPIPTQPIHQQYIYLADNRQHHKIVRGGMETTEKAMAIVGNGCGGIGFGMARHAQADRATELAVAAAQRDMIHVSLYKGQLYHDLVGKKNNIKVLIWSRAPGHEKPSGDHMITTIMELMGVRHYSAKIIGPKRRNPFTVAQALFNAFDNHLPYEVSAANRGLRLLNLGADRFKPRQAYPMSARGPSFTSASSYAHRTNQ